MPATIARAKSPVRNPPLSLSVQVTVSGSKAVIFNRIARASGRSPDALLADIVDTMTEEDDFSAAIDEVRSKMPKSVLARMDEMTEDDWAAI